jgi:hypothetical protein
MLMGEGIQKYTPRTLDGGAQMKGGAVQGNGMFSMPVYEEGSVETSNNNSASPSKGRVNRCFQPLPSPLVYVFSILQAHGS